MRMNKCGAVSTVTYTLTTNGRSSIFRIIHNNALVSVGPIFFLSVLVTFDQIDGGRVVKDKYLYNFFSISLFAILFSFFIFIQ